jgi:hypothetical protein
MTPDNEAAFGLLGVEIKDHVAALGPPLKQKDDKLDCMRIQSIQRAASGFAGHTD